jgi:rubrerythrin
VKNRPFKSSSLLLGSTLTISLLLVSGKIGAREAQTGQTLRNLQTAYAGESNAHARYLAFAQKADEEGYPQVASLFRAAARAESVHVTNHEFVIRATGAVPFKLAEFPVAQSTPENLAAAMKGEAYERDTMYPAFVAQADAEEDRDAARTFDLARKAEAQHFNLFFAALSGLQNGWSVDKTYYVCTVCGYTVSEPVTANCVSCASPAEKYEAVS